MPYRIVTSTSSTPAGAVITFGVVIGVIVGIVASVSLSVGIVASVIASVLSIAIGGWLAFAALLASTGIVAALIVVMLKVVLKPPNSGGVPLFLWLWLLLFFLVCALASLVSHNWLAGSFLALITCLIVIPVILRIRGIVSEN